jgi:hypothetical protein
MKKKGKKNDKKNCLELIIESITFRFEIVEIIM